MERRSRIYGADFLEKFLSWFLTRFFQLLFKRKPFKYRATLSSEQSNPVLKARPFSLHSKRFLSAAQEGSISKKYELLLLYGIFSYKQAVITNFSRFFHQAI
jgi:hypothetical protein